MEHRNISCDKKNVKILLKNSLEFIYTMPGALSKCVQVMHNNNNNLNDSKSIILSSYFFFERLNLTDTLYEK